MAELISPVNDSIRMPCDKSCKNSFFLTPSTSYEIINVIDSLSTKKATRSKDLETKFLKLSKFIIAPILSKLINMCFESGVFPNCLKIAEVVPIFKTGDRSKAMSKDRSTTDRFRCCLNSIKFWKKLFIIV